MLEVFGVPGLDGRQMILLNLGLRLALILWAGLHGNWQWGDTPAYLQESQLICSGSWGGASDHVPLYPAFLCLFSWGSPIMILMVQSLIVWGAGVWLYRQTRSKLAALIWLFDPTLLAYSHLGMTDGLYGVATLLTALQMWRTLNVKGKSQGQHALLLGICLGLAALTRPISIVLVIVTGIALLWQGVRRTDFRRSVVLCIVAFSFVVAPRIYWNGTRFGQWRLATQSDGWLRAVAGVVENHGQGLNFLQAELKWYKDHPQNRPSDAVDSILKRPLIWAYLSAKGTLRVLIGHVNPEWVMLLSGKNIEGPGWFKETQGKLSTGATLFWALGVFSCAIYCLFVYGFIIKSALLRRRWDSFDLWCLGSIAALVLMPQVFGEARFRIPVWGILLVLYAVRRPSLPRSRLSAMT